MQAPLSTPQGAASKPTASGGALCGQPEHRLLVRTEFVTPPPPPAVLGGIALVGQLAGKRRRAAQRKQKWYHLKSAPPPPAASPPAAEEPKPRPIILGTGEFPSYHLLDEAGDEGAPVSALHVRALVL